MSKGAVCGKDGTVGSDDGAIPDAASHAGFRSSTQPAVLASLRHHNPPTVEVFMQFERISHDPGVMGGKPCIPGLRVTAGMILGLLPTGGSRERTLEAYPYLEAEDIDAALAYAAWRLEEREEPLVVAWVRPIQRSWRGQSLAVNGRAHLSTVG